MQTITSHLETNNVDFTTFTSSIIMDHKKEDEDERCYAYTNQLINSCVLPMVMKVTSNMGVLQVIHDHAGPNGLSLEEITTRIQISNPNAPAMLDRMLRLLATYSVVRCTMVSTTDFGLERRYSPSPVTKYLIPDYSNGSLAGLLNLFTDKSFLDSWSKFGEAIIGGGIPFQIAHETSIFEYASVDTKFNEVFNKAMNQATTLTITKILEKYKGLENIQQVVDVGGGIGHTLCVITSKYPSIKAINFDLPHVIQNALPCKGVEHVSGDMFERIPEGDAIFMKWILHDWNDEQCLKVLRNCYKALPKNGKVIVVEEVMASEAESTNSSRATSQMDLTMMLVTLGGKERNRQQFEALAKGAGFSNITFDCCVYNLWVMELYK